jgi:hypothetical protein
MITLLSPGLPNPGPVCQLADGAGDAEGDDRPLPPKEPSQHDIGRHFKGGGRISLPSRRRETDVR